MAKYKYVRVSTSEQNTARQTEEADNYKHTFIEKASAKSTDNRPQLETLLNIIDEGDEVVVHSMDRLARNLRDLESIVKAITDKKAKITFQKEQLTFSSEEVNPMSKLLLQMMGAVAEFERSMIVNRANEGRAVAKAKGAHLGRRSALSQEQVEEIQTKIRNGANCSKLAAEYDVSRQTIYKVRDSIYKVI
jgi:DNA invertase Pin-like site-specific DNA recombinase